MNYLHTGYAMKKYLGNCWSDRRATQKDIGWEITFPNKDTSRYPLGNSRRTAQRTGQIHHFFMGKLTFSTGPFSIAILTYFDITSQPHWKQSEINILFLVARGKKQTFKPTRSSWVKIDYMGIIFLLSHIMMCIDIYIYIYIYIYPYDMLVLEAWK